MFEIPLLIWSNGTSLGAFEASVVTEQWREAGCRTVCPGFGEWREGHLAWNQYCVFAELCKERSKIKVHSSLSSPKLLLKQLFYEEYKLIFNCHLPGYIRWQFCICYSLKRIRGPSSLLLSASLVSNTCSLAFFLCSDVFSPAQVPFPGY